MDSTPTMTLSRDEAVSLIAAVPMFASMIGAPDSAEAYLKNFVDRSSALIVPGEVFSLVNTKGEALVRMVIK